MYFEVFTSNQAICVFVAICLIDLYIFLIPFLNIIKFVTDDAQGVQGCMVLALVSNSETICDCEHITAKRKES